jgi:(p)ppGpp synthase/HD superfamily hydrolase
MEHRPTVVLSSRYADAVAYAAAVHAEQPRKGTDVPYVAHLVGVSSLVLEAGGDEDLAIAALLHDAAEDHGGEARLEDIALRFGGRVADIVRQCSDSLPADGQAKGDWETRKAEHLARLRTAAPDVLVVWISDKVHNGRAIVTDVTCSGPAAWSRFHAPAPRIEWYYRANLEIAESRDVPCALLAPLRAVVAQISELVPR